MAAAEVLPQKNVVLILSSGSEAGEARAAVEKYKIDMAGRGISVTEVSADEAQDTDQAAALGGGSPVVKMENRDDKTAFKVYDGASGADITKSFNLAVEPKPAPSVELKKKEPQALVAKPEPIATPKLAAEILVKPAAENNYFPKNHIGLSIGPSNFKKNEDSLELLKSANPGSGVTYTKTSGRF